ncbi:hypothetical protein [Clostridium formicaceticum]|uniref:Uncharacterized protein n=1 Tax=Clostridium formicaceticum TaxID=1497 RepID=A0AAC9RGP9_9CLOT|nr:hypothetical protein [Clostridium formicaceticum]AOY76182.1 hypothetical protein BJL90_09870 [Clostridium formicaceticum]ARE86554.1 hypothetical protein CLFO_08780 [Clostridium formicaceticum]
MSELNQNDVFSNFFGGIFKGKSNILIILVLCLLLTQSKCGFWGKFDENLILVFVVIICLFGGSFRF